MTFLSPVGMSALLVGLPLVSGKLGLHDSLLLLILSVMVGTSAFITAFSNKVWHFYVAQLGSYFSICVYSTARSLLTKGTTCLKKILSL